MVLKRRAFVIVSLIVMLLSGVVSVNMSHGIDVVPNEDKANPTFSYIDGVLTLNPSTAAQILSTEIEANRRNSHLAEDMVNILNTPKNYIPTTVDDENPNLFIGGIWQASPNADYANPEHKLKEFADQNGAIFIPTYYTGAGDIPAVNDAADSKKTDVNGLTRDELTGKTYGTIIGYSGGTTTVVTAMAEQEVKAETLILISPMMGIVKNSKDKFEQKIQTILTLNPGIKIVVIQSPDDKPFGGLGQYNFDGSKFEDKVQLISNADLGERGVFFNGHEAIFRTYAMNNIRNGVFTGSPQPSTKNIATDTPELEDTTPVAADVLSVGIPQDDKQGTTSTASQSANTKSQGVASSPSSSVRQAIDNLEPGEYNHYESTIPIPIGPAADALKAQGKYEEYLENALQAAEDRTAQNSQDGDAWYTKGLALHYLNRDEEANVAFAQAKELGIQFESNGESFTRVGQTEPTTQATEMTKPTDESNAEDSTVIPTLYPITSLPPDESNAKKSSTTSQSTDTKFGDAKLSVTQPVDPQPDLAFGQIFRNNQQMATSSSEPAFGDSQPDLAFGDNMVAQERKQPKPTATAVQEKNGIFVIDSQSAQEVFQRISKYKEDDQARKEEIIEMGLQQAVALCIQGRYEDAIRVYATACGDQYEVYPYMYNVIGEALQKIGRTTEANICFTKARKGQQILDSYSPPSPRSSSPSRSSSSSSSGSPGSSGPNLEEINRQFADPNSQLSQELLNNVNE